MPFSIESPSPYQQAIFDDVSTGSGHLVVKAVAGGSKTTTGVASLSLIPASKRVIFLAYNKSIAETLKARVPGNVKASTFHSYGFYIVKQLYPSALMDKDKAYDAIQRLSKEASWEIPKEDKAAFFNRVEDLVDLMRLTLRTTEEEIELLCAEFGIDNDDGESGYALQAFNAVHADTTRFDFADMVYMPASRDFKVRGFDFVYVDEFQDCSEAQFRFARKLLGPGGRLVVIGDPNQSIYAYMGAEPRLFDEVTSLPGAKALPLSISYRCSRAVVAHAQKLVPEIEAAPGAPEGEVVLKGSIKNVRAGDFILCRINLPLVKLALDFIKRGQRATIKGSDIGRGLVSFIQHYVDGSVEDMEEALERKKTKLANKLVAKFPYRDLDSNSEYQRLSEKIDTIRVLAEDVTSVTDIISKVQRLFSDDTSSGIILSTIHKAKGLEARNVFIVEPQLIPFPYNTEQAWQQEQERNIDYVARTRAIEKLEYITDWSFFRKGKRNSG